MLAKTLRPTAEQSAIIEAARSTKDSILISALAGAAKTSTLEMICAALPVQPILCLAFNKRIAEEMKSRLPGHVTVKTMNALGHGIWAAACAKRLIVNTRKSYELLKGKIDALPRPQRLEAYDTFSETLKAIGKAKLAGYVPDGVYPHAKRLVSRGVFEESLDEELCGDMQGILRDEVLTDSIRLAYEGQIDFDDQIYLPCQPAGTQVEITREGSQGSEKVPIEKICAGDRIVSFDRRLSKFIGLYNHGTLVNEVVQRKYSGLLYEVMAANKRTEATLEHKWLVRFKPEIQRKQLFFTYLMQRGNSFKIGQTQIRCVRPGSRDGFGLSVRCSMERADSAWILGVYSTLQEAKSAEAMIAATYGITDKSFTSEIGREIHTAQEQNTALLGRAKECLVNFDRDIRFPFWRPHVTRGFNSNFIVESCNLVDEIMEIPIFEGTENPKWASIYTNKRQVFMLDVYSLEVARHELYVANDILTHNCLFGGTFPRFPLVMVDEAQDLSPLNHAMLQKLVTGRLIAVGDPFQSIYGFRGAMTNGMECMGNYFNMKQMTLSTSFRCPRSIVRRAQSRAPHMNFPEWAEEGVIHDLSQGAQHIQWSAASIPEGAAIICRNNAPLFRLGFALIRSGRGVSIVGQDIGPGLVKVLKKLGPETMTQDEVFTAIDKWEGERGRKAKSKESIADRAECLRVFAEHGNTLSGAVAYAEHLFKSTGTIQLLSGHKAKGLEWDTVYHLDPHRIPSPWAQSAEDLEQEANINYVITTRAKKELWLVTMEGFSG